MSEALPQGIRARVVEEVQANLEALERRDISYLVDRLSTRDHWRILEHFIDDVSFFDIETAGLEYDDPVTVIACWHRGRIQTFVEHENLDEFLDLLDEVTLLSSFNGSTFDVPRILDAFHIPELPCPHLDLRWLCYHRDLRGGLKEISYRLKLNRPDDLRHVNGETAIRWWARWEHFQDRQARADLLRYCAADVILLVVLAEELIGRSSRRHDSIWSQLPQGSQSARPDIAQQDGPFQLDGAFGEASPRKLRGRKYAG